MLPHRRQLTATAEKLGFLLGLILLVTLAHFFVDQTTYGRHVIHIILAGAYLLPVIGAALWYRLRGAITSAFLVSLLYYLHIRFSWANQPMENANQFGWIAVFWILGIVCGVLVELEERQRERRLRAERDAEREAVIEGIAGLSNALRARDEYTRVHSEHVSRLAVDIAKRLGLSGERLDIVRLAGLVHDIGKIGVRDDVLLKPEELTAEERVAVERHPSVAAEILRPIRGAREIAEIVLAHHECPDGSGYPRGLKAHQIPLEAHIVRVADIYASLTEKRPYKSAIDPSAALEIMDGFAGAKVDAQAFRALLQLAQEPSCIAETSGGRRTSP